MERVKDICKSFIMLFSEIIWIYYVIVMFTSVSWNRPVFFDLSWMMAAGMVGYALNSVLAKTSNNILLFSGNVLTLGFIIMQSWKAVVPQGSWVFGLGTSIGIGLIFIRSAILVYRKPVRHEILRRFEGNIIFYIVFAIIFTLNDWSNQSFHLMFIYAISGNLIGMLLTLQSYEDGQDNQEIKIVKAGQPGWFAGFMTFLLICIPVISLILLLPSVNSALYAFGTAAWEILKWAVLKIWYFVVWLLSLFPEPKTGATSDIPAGKTFITPDIIEKNFNSLYYIFILSGAAIFLFLMTICYLMNLIINRKLPKTIKPKYIKITREPWWPNFKRSLRDCLKHLKLKWCMCFPWFYYNSIYWYYQQVLIWGKKNGFIKLKSETSREYIHKIIAHISEEENNFSWRNQSYHLTELLSRLNRDYQAVYYGGKAEIYGEAEYKALINHLKGMSINDRILQGIE